MERIKHPCRVNRHLRSVQITKYDNLDVINQDNAIGKASIPYVEKVLRKRLDGIRKTDTHPKKQMIKEIALNILHEYIRYIINELILGNRVYIPKVGHLQLRTRKFVTKSNIYPREKARAKNKGFFTMIEYDYEIPKAKFRYSYPYIAFGKSYKKKIWKQEDNGIKY